YASPPADCCAAILGAGAGTIPCPTAAPSDLLPDRQPDMEQKNLLLAIVLSVGILIGFQFLFEKMRPPTPPPSTIQVSPQAQPGTTPPPPPGTTALPESAAAAPAKPETREQALAEQPRVRINTPRLHGSIGLVGGRIDDLTLADYRETVDPHSPEV